VQFCYDAGSTGSGISSDLPQKIWTKYMEACKDMEACVSPSSSLSFCFLKTSKCYSEECTVVDKPARGGGLIRKHSGVSGQDQRTQPVKWQGWQIRLMKSLRQN